MIGTVKIIIQFLQKKIQQVLLLENIGFFEEGLGSMMFQEPTF